MVSVYLLKELFLFVFVQLSFHATNFTFSGHNLHPNLAAQNLVYVYV